MTKTKLTDDTPVDPEDELLVAYLDGELDRVERGKLESRLVDEGGLRERLQKLQQGWDLLDELDGPEPSHELVESTLQLVVADLQPSPNHSATILGRYRWTIGVFVACAIGVGSTLAIASTIKSRRYNLQLKELAIVENLDAYLHGSDLDLMRQLASDREWQQMVEASREIGYTLERTIESITHVSSTPVAEREAMIANLPLEKRAELKSRWERFKRLDPKDRSRIRETADTVAAQTDASELLQTMNTYVLWRENIPSTELRDKIESDDPKTRSEAIFVAIRYTQHELAEQSSNTLDEETVERIYYVLRQIVRQRVEQGGDDMKKAFERIEKIAGGKDAIDTALRMVFLPSDLSNDLFGDHPPEPLTESEMEWIRLILPSDAIETLYTISGGYAMTETMTLHIWAEEAVRRRYRPRTETTLERYQLLDPAQREVMDLLSSQEILEKLTE